MKPVRRNNHPLGQLKDEMNGVFQRFFEDPFFTINPFSGREGTLTPALNVEEKGDRYTVEVEIPGMDPNDVNISLEGNVLTIEGENNEEHESEDSDRKMHIMERKYGSFQRSLTLPDNVDADQISASCENGLLFIDVPKNKASEARRINIKHKGNE